MTSKTCTRCSKEWPETAEFFHRRGINAFQPTCKSCSSERGREYRATHQESEAARKQRWSEDNRDMKRAQSQRHYKNHREQHLTRMATWRAENGEWFRQYYEQHRDQFRLHCSNRAARKRHAGGAFTGDDVHSQYKAQAGLCFYCRKPVEGDYHIDHWMPLALGGSNDSTNIVIACPTCNWSKNAKHPDEFMRLLDAEHAKG